jgi:transcriptional antiterminator NusG
MEQAVLPSPHDGQIVKVVDGPFSGFAGPVMAVLEENRKVEVLITLFGRRMALSFDRKQIEILSR